MKRIQHWGICLAGVFLLAGCAKQSDQTSSADLELQAARQSVKQLQEQLNRVSTEMSDRMQKEGDRIRAEAKIQLDQAATELKKAKEHIQLLEQRGQELATLAQEAARPSTNTLQNGQTEGIPSDLFLDIHGQQGRGIAVRMARDRIVIRTPSGGLATNRLSNIQEIAFRSGPVLSGIVATNTPMTAIANIPSAKGYRPPGDGIKLSPYWRGAIPQGDLITRDLRTLLARLAQPKADLGVTENLEIMDGIFYQMPAQDVFKVLGKQPTAPRKGIVAPGFPKQSLYYYEVAGPIRDFPTLLLITDTADQTVAVQLSDESLNVKPSTHVRDEGFSIHNLIKARKKPNAASFINYRAVATNNNTVVVLDSRLYDTQAAVPRGLPPAERNRPDFVRMKERHILYLPQPVADLISLCLTLY